MTVGYNKPLYVLPFDHRATFSKTMFGWTGQLAPEQTAQIAAVKQVIYDAGPLTFKERTVYQMVGYTRGSGTLVNGALLVIDTVGTSSIVDSLLAQLKLVHAAPNTPAINALIGGTVTFANVPYQSASSYEGVSSGPHTVTVETASAPGAVRSWIQPTKPERYSSTELPSIE